jgi:hypothetical protein
VLVYMVKAAMVAVDRAQAPVDQVAVDQEERLG